MERIGNLVEGSVERIGNLVEGTMERIGNRVEGTMERIGNLVEGTVDILKLLTIYHINSYNVRLISSKSTIHHRSSGRLGNVCQVRVWDRSSVKSNNVVLPIYECCWVIYSSM